MNSESKQFRSNLLSLVSHELNTPLTGILNAISVLEEQEIDNAEYLSMLKRNAERLKATVRNMMDMAEVDAGVVRVRLSEISLENFLFLQQEKLKPELEKSGFQFEIEVENDLPNVCADSNRLFRVFATLVLNAMKFSDPSKIKKDSLVRVKLSMQPIASIPQEYLKDEIFEKTALFLVVEVSSSLPAIGEAPESFEQLFEPFSPWKDVHTRQKDGIGLELALTREIMLAHDGFIGAGPSQRDGEGWVFRFGLPVLSRLDELAFVIENRLHGALGVLAKMSLLVLRPDPESLVKVGDLQLIENQIQDLLFRSSDSVFSLPTEGEITVVLDDCNAVGADKIGKRLAEQLQQKIPGLKFMWAVATGPDHGTNARELLDSAHNNWNPMG